MTSPSRRTPTDARTPARIETRFVPGVPTWLILLVMFVGGLCSLLALNTASAAAEVEQRAVVDANASASDQQQQLQRDLSLREAPDVLARTAIALGLVPNPNPAFLRMNADGSVTVLGQAMPASIAPPPPPPVVAVPTTTAPTAKARPTSKPTSTGSTHKRTSATTTSRPAASTPAHSAAPHPTSTGGHG